MNPKTAVRSLGRTTALRKAERGAVSIDCVQERKIRKRIARGRLEGNGTSARKMEEGRWVKTMVWMLPMRLASEEARSMDTAAMQLVTKKMEPSFPSARLNLVWKKNVCQDLRLG